VFFDFYDFLLAGGMITLPLVALKLADRTGECEQRKHERILTMVGLVSILVIDFTGLIRCESARVWLFLQPLIVVPAGLQLARFGPRVRVLVLALEALIVLALKSKMDFFP
jgi:hypothetical protein